jgi:hypothetical protein
MTKTITSSKSKKTSTKKGKDPNAPKRYRTGYLLFSAEKRDEVKVIIFIDLFSFLLIYFFQNENPGLSSREILAELGAQWKAADAAV